jgi:A/G-specific adenine glycosylase
MTPAKRPGDFAQAMMDLGATICTPKRPACVLCPWADACAAHAAGTQEAYPVRTAKAARPTRYGVAFVAVRSDGAVLLRTRPDAGLLGGMTEVPGTEWKSLFNGIDADAHAPIQAAWGQVPGRVVHVFTHFRLELAIFCADAGAKPPTPAGMWWSPRQAIGGEALPSVMRKAIEAALPGAMKRRKAD